MSETYTLWSRQPRQRWKAVYRGPKTDCDQEQLRLARLATGCIDLAVTAAGRTPWEKLDAPKEIET